MLQKGPGRVLWQQMTEGCHLKGRQGGAVKTWGICQVFLLHDCLSVLSGSKMLSVRNHAVLLGCYRESAQLAGSVKSGKISAIYSEKWNHLPASNTPGLIFVTEEPLFSTQLSFVPQISFVFQYLIALFTSATDSQAIFKYICTIKYAYILMSQKELCPCCDWGYKEPLYPVRPML